MTRREHRGSFVVLAAALATFALPAFAIDVPKIAPVRATGSVIAITNKGRMSPNHRASYAASFNLPGAGQMRHARALIESGPYFDRMPDPSLVAPPNANGPDYVAACRAPDARYALIYIPSGKPATIRTFLLKGPRLTAQWFDPRTGERRDLPPIEVVPWKTTEFKPPVVDQDWVLVLESKQKQP